MNSLVDDIKDGPIGSTFKSAHSDKDIIDYVKEEHGLDVKVVENHGPKNIKTNKDGYAIVSPKNATRFKVFINSFGAISGDNYSYLTAKPQVRKHIENSEEALYITEKVFDHINVLTDDETMSFEIDLTIRSSIDLADQEFIEQLYSAYETIQAWNVEFKEAHGYVIRQLNLSYDEDDIEAPITEVLNFSVTSDVMTMDELEEYLFESTQHALNKMFVQENNDALSEINDGFPEELILPFNSESEILRCQASTSFGTCDSFKLVVAQNKVIDRFYYSEYSHDNPEMIEFLYETIEFLQTVDLPIDTIILKDLNLPEQINKAEIPEDKIFAEDFIEAYETDDVEVRQIKDIDSVKDILLYPYEDELNF